ncbi:MAG: PDZ domain-containing protein [Chloroflexi bacterium]|nr:PDZ domain-containing protein [Chloroflexota bacterium]
MHTGRPYLGISPTDGSTGSGFGGGFFGPGDGGSTVTGALVQQIASNGPAAKAGVQQGDVITALNGTSISSVQDLFTALAREKPGDTVTLTLNRNGSTVTVHVHLGELPAS